MDFIRKPSKNSMAFDLSPVAHLHFPALDATGIVRHCFSTRMGGVSEGHLGSMNLSYTRGDEKERVDENYRRIAEAIGTTPEHIVTSHQTHTTHVIRVGKAEEGFGVTRERPYTDVDGLVTNEPGTVLATFFADCVPLFFVDPVHKAIGLSHSGWKGTAGRMGKATLAKMKADFGTEAKDVICAIGPSICQSCYEISEDVAVRFQAEFKGHEEEILVNKGNGKYQLDLWRCNEIILTEAGVLPEHISVTDICTCCNPKLLFSHRASNGMRGNLGAFMYLI